MVRPLLPDDAVAGASGHIAAHNALIDAVEDLRTVQDGKAPTTHTHTTAQVTGLDTALTGKASTVHAHGYEDLPSDIATEGYVDTAVAIAGSGRGPRYVVRNNNTWVDIATGEAVTTRPTVPAWPLAWVVWDTTGDQTFQTPPPLAVIHDQWRYHKDAAPRSA